MTGIIVKALSGFYYVESDGTIYECKARGSFRKSGNTPLVGDSVEFESTGEKSGIVDKILPRKNMLSRPPVANIDKLFIVSAYQSPAPNTFLIDKMTVLAVYNNIEPIIVFNKSDMGDFSDWQRLYENAGFKTYVISAEKKEGINALADEMQGVISAFTGNSGVGKSSILNTLFGEEVIATGDISEKLGRGRHTTRHTELYRLPFGGFVADTPGFSSLDIDKTDYDLKEKLDLCFKDFEAYVGDCRFSSCTHTNEKGCAVLEALKGKKLMPSRHESYIKIFEEMKDLKPWETKKHKKS